MSTRRASSHTWSWVGSSSGAGRPRTAAPARPSWSWQTSWGRACGGRRRPGPRGARTASQLPTRADRAGISPQQADTVGRSWTVCLCVRIRCSDARRPRWASRVQRCTHQDQKEWSATFDFVQTDRKYMHLPLGLFILLGRPDPPPQIHDLKVMPTFPQALVNDRKHMLAQQVTLQVHIPESRGDKYRDGGPRHESLPVTAPRPEANAPVPAPCSPPLPFTAARLPR